MPKEKKAPKEKKKKRRGAAVFVIILIIIIALLVIVFFDPFGWGFGFGNGGNIFGGLGNSSSATDEGGGSPDDEEIFSVVLIRIENNDIYFGDEPCADAEELKEKITQTGTEKEYELIHDTAIKATFDEVKAVLTGLEDALGITVNYNE